MPTLKPGLSQTYQLQPGETLSITTDAASICRYGQLPQPPILPGGADMPGSPISVPASSAVMIGPRSDISRWLIDSVIGPGVNVTQNAAASVPDSGAPLDLMHLFGSGAPAATVGQNQAQTGSLYTDFSAGKLYVNSGSKATPSWRIVTSA
jgi:hypothetical protein